MFRLQPLPHRQDFCELVLCLAGKAHRVLLNSNPTTSSFSGWLVSLGDRGKSQPNPSEPTTASLARSTSGRHRRDVSFTRPQAFCGVLPLGCRQPLLQDATAAAESGAGTHQCVTSTLMQCCQVPQCKF